MYIPGLVSVTFRQLDVPTIIDLCQQHGLQAIEWGGDIHVPHGDVDIATRTAKATRDAGLTVAAYGSYYRCDPAAEQPPFADVLASAQALGAPIIRVWAGTQGSTSTPPEKRTDITHDLIRVSRLAAEHGIDIAIEYHANTLTDDPNSALALIEAVNQPNVKLYWQPTNGKSADYCLATLQNLRPHISHLHAFHWNFVGDTGERRPLSEALETWRRYLSLATPAPQTRRAVMLEFVRDDSPEQLAADARTLTTLLREFA